MGEYVTLHGLHIELIWMRMKIKNEKSPSNMLLTACFVPINSNTIFNQAETIRYAGFSSQNSFVQHMLKKSMMNSHVPSHYT